jgi:hypothetical protein
MTLKMSSKISVINSVNCLAVIQAFDYSTHQIIVLASPLISSARMLRPSIVGIRFSQLKK